jgi:hypothetical protein
VHTKTERIARHIENIQRIFHNTRECEPEVLAFNLRALERRARRLATDASDRPMTTDEYAQREEIILLELDRTLRFRAAKIPVFLNDDARGYALKIQADYVSEHKLMIHTDLGGYGILWPEF